MRNVVVPRVKRLGAIERFDVHVGANGKPNSYVERQASKIECRRRPAGAFGKAPAAPPVGAQDVRGRQSGDGRKHDGGKHAYPIAGNADGAIGNAQETDESH